MRLKNYVDLLKVYISKGFGNRKKIIFIHPPKCAGSTINWLIKKDLEKKFWSKTVKINEVFLVDNINSLIKKAHNANYVYGHMSIEMARQVENSGTFIFTFLREPESRLLSLYNYSKNLSSPKLEKALGDKLLAAKLKKMSQMDFFGSNESRLRFDLDNYYVRCFSGPLYVFPQTEEEWMKALEIAKNNLMELHFVGFQDFFDDHLKMLLAKLDMSVPASMPKRNVTSQLDGGSESGLSKEISDEARGSVDQLIKYDRLLYEWAVRYFRTNN